ncbi:HIT family protein [Scytonema sp. NUACC26]|uniref:HIT family protein n=1 Tax=Scytonema sp. NUACC26 TaxID=3140176 RepID=UPI0034DC6350
MQKFDGNCLSCQAIQGFISLSNAPRIVETNYWIVEHTHPTSIKGWLVVVLKRHCHALHQLTQDEFTEFSQLMTFLCQALHEILNTDKEYIAQFAEGEGFNHVHFHVIACLPEWSATVRGPLVFSGLGSQVEYPLPSEVLTPLVLKIREYLLARLDERVN